MRSLTGTLFRRVILGTALVLAAAGTILYISVSSQLVRQMDELLTEKVHSLSLSVEEKHYGLEVDLEEMRTVEMEEADIPEFLYVGTLGGRLIYRSDALHDIPIPDFSEPVQGPMRDWHELEHGMKLRSVLITYVPDVDEEEEPERESGNPGIIVDTSADSGDPVVIQVFRDASSYLRFLKLFMFMLLATGFGSIGILSLIAWLTIKRGAKPIHELASRIEGIRDDDLAERLDEGTVLRELAPIVHKFNLFLDRLEGSFSRERGFTSDAAHELRTPLAGLKSTIEVSLAKERERGEYRETLVRALEIVIQLENLVKSLLALAKLESGQETAAGSQIALENCIREAWVTCSGDADEKHLKTVFNFSNGSVAKVDRDLFCQALEELFRNAVYYADEGGLVSVSVFPRDGTLQLRVSNSGSKISPGEADRVFDRFWRGSHSRDDTGVRFGLGLPIVRRIVDTMGMQIDVESELDGEFVVTLIIPTGN